MAFIRTIDPRDADGPVEAMYRRQQSAWGYVPNYATVFCYRPEAMVRWGQLLAEVRRPMDARRFELVTFAAAHELHHSACTLAHGRRLQEWFGDDDIAALAAERSVEGLDDAERAMLRFARQVARDAASVTQSDVDALRAAGLSDAEVFDVAAVAAARAFFTKLLDALGVAPDAPFLELPPKLRQLLGVGREIDHRPTVSLP